MTQTRITVPVPVPDSFIGGVRQIPVQRSTGLGLVVDAVTYQQRQIEELRFQVTVQAFLILLVAVLMIVPPRIWRQWAKVKLWLIAGVILVSGCKLDALASPCERREDTRWVGLVFQVDSAKADTVALMVRCEGPYKKSVFPPKTP